MVFKPYFSSDKFEASVCDLLSDKNWICLIESDSFSCNISRSSSN